MRAMRCPSASPFLRSSSAATSRRPPEPAPAPTATVGVASAARRRSAEHALAISKPRPSASSPSATSTAISTPRGARSASRARSTTKDAWIGGKLVVVQTGDAIDRGDDDRADPRSLRAPEGRGSEGGRRGRRARGQPRDHERELDFRYVTPRRVLRVLRRERRRTRPSRRRASKVDARGARPRSGVSSRAARTRRCSRERPVVARVGRLDLRRTAASCRSTSPTGLDEHQRRARASGSSARSARSRKELTRRGRPALDAHVLGGAGPRGVRDARRGAQGARTRSAW